MNVIKQWFGESHPSRHALLGYVEGLLCRHVALAPEISRHIARCDRCKCETVAMRRSLDLTNDAAEIEPSRHFTASILMATRNVALEPPVPWPRSVRGYASVAMLVAVVALAYTGIAAQYSLNTDTEGIERKAAVVSFDMLRRLSTEEKVLGPAIMSAEWEPQGKWERAQRRALDILDDDLAEALAAFKDNPACVRASSVVTSIREKKVETLKAVYLERSL